MSCKGNHQNDGTDVCTDCGEDLQAVKPKEVFDRTRFLKACGVEEGK